jgi:hypothetical protein
MVYILGRMGDNKKALMLIIRRLDDVQRVKMKKNGFSLFFFSTVLLNTLLGY